MKHWFSYSMKSAVVLATAILIPFISSAASYRFTVARNSAAATSAGDYMRGVALSGNCNYLVGVNQVYSTTQTSPTYAFNVATYRIINVSNGAVTTADALGGTWGGSDFAIANDDNGIVVHPKHYNPSYLAPWRWLYKGNFNTGTVASVGNNWTLTNSGDYTTTSTGIRSQAFRINGDIEGSSSVWSCPASQNYVLEFIGVNGAFSSCKTYTLSGIPSGYTHGALATGYKYDTNKFLICSPNGVFNCTISGSTMSATNVTPGGVNNINLVGSAIFKLRDHIFFVRSTSNTSGASNFGIFDVTNGFPGTSIYADTPRSGTGATAGTNMWINFHKQNDNTMIIVVFVRGLCVAKYTMNALEVLANPTFSPASGTTFNYGSNNVTITGPSGSTIYYKVNGTQRSGASPVTVAVTQNTSLTEVYAQKNGYWDSGNVSASYNVRSADVTYSPSSDTSFSGSTNITLTSASGGTIYYTTNGTTPTTSSSSVASGGTVTISSTCQIKAFAVSSGYVAGNVTTSPTYTKQVPLASPTFSPASGTQFTGTGSVTITAPSGSTLHYSTDGGSSYTTASGNTATVNITEATTLKAYATQTDKTDSSVATASYTVKCATPTANINGGTYTTHQRITLSCATSGATIRYTTDGSEPTSSSAAYSSTITLTETTRLRAKAFKSNCVTSDEFDQTYTINATLDAPTFSVASGTQFTTSGSVTITAPSGSTLHYSTDGGSNYAAASGNTVTLTIYQTATIKAYATQSYKTDSPVATASYTVKCATPTITPVTGTYPKEQSVNIACATPGATIYYTLDGSTPTTSSPVYYAPLTVNDGNTTNEYIPLYGYYADDYEKSEYIIPASTLSGLGASASSAVVLNSLTWYISQKAAKRFDPALFKVFLKEVSGTTLGGSFIGTDGATVVYEGALDATQATITVNFSTPYEYHGGNLLVGVYTTTTNGAYSHAYFYGTTGESDCSAYATDGSSLDNITEPNSTNFLPKTTFTYTPNHQPIIVSSTTTVKAIAVMSGCVNSDVASETITIKPQSAPATNIGISYSPVIGVSTNNPSGDLARIDATITFDRPVTSDGGTFPVYPSQFSDYYLDHYIVTVFSGSGYAKTESGANFLNVNIDAKTGAGAANTVTLKARDLKVGQNTEVYVTAHYIYSPASTASQSAQASNTAAGYTYTTYSPSISAVTYCEPHQAHDIWWGSQQSGEKHTCYFDVYRVEITIDDNPLYNPSTSIPVSYYQLKVSKNNGSTWENVTDRTVDMVAYGDDSNTYPIGQGIGAGRFKGNYRFSSNKIASPSGSGQISLWYYYAYDVTSAYSPTSVTDPSQGNPAAWLYRIEAVYGGSESVNVSGTAVTPTNVNITSSEYADYMPSDTNPVITGVDNVGNDIDGVKEVQYYDLKGVRLLEAPATGIYIEVRLMNNGQVVTSKRLAR